MKIHPMKVYMLAPLAIMFAVLLGAFIGGEHLYVQIQQPGEGCGEAGDGAVLKDVSKKTASLRVLWGVIIGTCIVSLGMMFLFLYMYIDRIEKEILRSNNELRLLNKVNRVLNSSLELDQVLAATLSWIRELLGAAGSSIWLTDSETDGVVCHQAVGERSEMVRGSRLARGQGLVGHVIEHDVSVNTPDTRDDIRHFKGVDLETGVEIRSILSAPLRVRNEVIGALQAVSRSTAAFSETDRALLETMAAPSATAIQRARLFKALHGREALYRTLFKDNHDIMLVIDPVTDEIKDANRAACGFYGCDPDEITGMKITDIEFTAESSGDRELAEDDNNRTERFLFKHRSAGGDIRDVEVFRAPLTIGSHRLLYAVVHDVTDKIHAERTIQTLVESTVRGIGQDFFDRVAKKVCDWLHCEYAIIGEIVGDSEINVISMLVDGQFTHGCSYALTGTPCGQIVEHGFSVHPEGVIDLFPDCNDLVEMKAVGHVGVPLVDGNETVIGVFCAASRDRLNAPERLEDIFNIIAARVSAEIERKRMEDYQRKLRIDLQQAQKMEAIGALAGGIAHDFNNILAAIMGYTQLLQPMLPRDGDAADFLMHILKASHRAKELVRQILAFSRRSQYEKRPCDIGAEAKEALKLLRASLPATIEIHHDIPSNLGVVMADQTKIHQVIMNLCTNAFHAMEAAGGRLDVLLDSVVSGAEEAPGHLLGPGRYLKLTVRDDGLGMDAGTISRIFDPYFTTKKLGKGTGMGLATVHGIVQDHGGAILVNSAPGEGAVFELFFPVYEGEGASKSTDRKPLPTGAERILFVDDEKPLIDIGKKILERLGYTVEARSSSHEALEVFRADPLHFDLVITDMTMPEMTGEDLARKIIAIRPDIPVILCTGFIKSARPERWRQTGIRELLGKPLTIQTLAEAVQRALKEN